MRLQHGLRLHEGRLSALHVAEQVDLANAADVLSLSPSVTLFSIIRGLLGKRVQRVQRELCILLQLSQLLLLLVRDGVGRADFEEFRLVSAAAKRTQSRDCGVLFPWRSYGHALEYHPLVGGLLLGGSVSFGES